jgi:hypothetical protein
MLERFDALCRELQGITDDGERARLVEDFVGAEAVRKRIEEIRDPQCLLPLLDSFMHADELTQLQAEVEDSGAADQLRLFTVGGTG